MREGKGSGKKKDASPNEEKMADSPPQTSVLFVLPTEFLHLYEFFSSNVCILVPPWPVRPNERVARPRRQAHLPSAGGGKGANSFFDGCRDKLTRTALLRSQKEAKSLARRKTSTPSDAVPELDESEQRS